MSTISSPRYETGVALVAGGSGGLGGATCRALADAGAHIALTYNHGVERAEAVASEVRQSGRKALALQVDLADEARVAQVVAEAVFEFGAIHTVVYAAGPYVPMRHVSKLDSDEFRQTVSSDIFGAYHLIHAALPHLRESRGALVALTTTATRRYAVKDIMSVAPKAAVEGLVKAVAAEEGRFGVRANCVGVGVIDGGMLPLLIERGDLDERSLAAAKGGLALRRLGTPDEVAAAVEFLASDRASFITGQTLMVDGGYSM